MSPTLIDLGLVLVGLVVLTGGADALVRGAGALALRVGLSPLVVGLTVVAFGTSSPELAVSAEAALGGNSAIALGNVVGSNLFNITLILGTAALIRTMTVDRALVRRDLPVMLAATVLPVLMLLDGVVGRLDGAVLVAGLVAYTAFNVRTSRREAKAAAAEMDDDMRAALEAARRPLWWSLGLLVAGLAALVVGAGWLRDGAVGLATEVGVSPAVIGLTLVAAGTSLPELATSVVAARNGAPEIALGNVVGSNTFNGLGVLGVAAVLHPVGMGGVTWPTLGAMVVASVLAAGLVAWRGRLGRAEGAALLLVYAAYTALLVTTTPVA